MKILYVLDSPYAFNNGCWFYRNHLVGRALKDKGHLVESVALNSGVGIPEHLLTFPDIVVFSRTYYIDPLNTLRKFKKLGKKVVWEIDDDLWTVNPDNPSAALSEEKKRQYEHLADECDAITTTTPFLAKKLRKWNKNVFVCPNAIYPGMFDLKDPRAAEDRKKEKKLRIGYTGAASHWNDLMILKEPVLELKKKYDFDFILQGMCGQPLEAEIWGYARILEYGLQPEKKLFLTAAVKWYEEFWLKLTDHAHVPFYPPVMYPGLLATLNLDIGLAPLHDNEFNKGKSCVKFYEYASTGAATLASKMLPYSEEVGYLAKNTSKDWYKKLEKLIADEKFRKELAAKQFKFVSENRTTQATVRAWEDALDTQ